jgi:pantetheine-phosphate adenylyltransferase
MSSFVRAIYPGSFDPVTNGHLDILARAARLFDSVVIVASEIGRKRYEFNLDERVQLLKDSVGALRIDNVEIDSFGGLLVDYAHKREAHVIVRGLREVSDFEYEYQMAVMNRKLAPEIETVFLSTGSEFYFVSSTLVKEVAALNGDITGLVPECVRVALIGHVTGGARG